MIDRVVARHLKKAEVLVIDGMTVSVGSSKRPVVVAETSTSGRVALYRSTGTFGGAREGDWVPFYGLADQFGLGYPYVVRLWFVKGASKRPTPGTPLAEAAEAAREAWETGAASSSYVVSVGGLHGPSTRVGDMLEGMADAERLNAWLASQGALVDRSRWLDGAVPIGPGGKTAASFRMWAVARAKAAGLTWPRAVALTIDELMAA